MVETLFCGMDESSWISEALAMKSVEDESTLEDLMMTEFEISHLLSTDQYSDTFSVKKSLQIDDERENDLDDFTQVRDFLVQLLEEQCEINNWKAFVPGVHDKSSMFYSPTKQRISMYDYISRIIRLLDVSVSSYIAAAEYLRRLVTKYPDLFISHFNVHRLFITALQLGIKYAEDVPYNTQSMMKVGGLSSMKEICTLEKYMLHLLDYKLYISSDIFNHTMQLIKSC
mmetsp:Transcript_6798/g.12166  ORF Transcript_6798/g.12166 Transcript_6798/m.12166 type:complete len:228 (+) Transcript_6798:285-968(+)